MEQEFTRQIYWSPSGGLSTLLHRSTYLWLALATGIFLWGVWRHIKLWRMGKPEACFDNPLERTKAFMANVVGQAKVLRERRERTKKGEPSQHSSFAGVMHGLIFYGFLALVFGTTIVGLKDYGIVDLYRGWFYGFVTIICELGGVALIIGVSMGIWRRFAQPQLFAHKKDYTILYALLLVLSIQGYLLEGLRLSQQANPVDLGWSFVGSVFSWLFPKKMDVAIADNLYAGLWYFHMVSTMAFVASIPYTRAMHIVTASLNLYTQRLTPPVILQPLDLENSEAEYFGPKTIRDFTWKELLSFDSCTECRRCTDICPANAAEKTLDPRQVILKLRDSMAAEAQLATGATTASLYEDGIITNAEIWACTNCGACVNECPVGIDQLGAIMQLRRYQTLSLGEVPSMAARAIENIKQHNNPWGVSHSDRFNWAEGLNVPVITGDSPAVEWLYWVGCAGSYDSSNQKVARNVVQLLKSAGVDFAVMGKAEKCTGEPVKRLGDEYTFSELARSNVEQLQNLKFKKIVTHCPHCYNTLKNDYKEYGGAFEVYHHTQLLTQLHQSGALKLPGAINREVTFHDPCFLGRHNGEYEAPRQLLEAVAGLRIQEMEFSRETSHCCGMGGGNMWYESEGGHHVVEDRLHQVAETKAKTLVTGCSFCLINFKGAFKNLEATKDLEVMDIAEALVMALPPQEVPSQRV